MQTLASEWSLLQWMLPELVKSWAVSVWQSSHTQISPEPENKDGDQSIKISVDQLELINIELTERSDPSEVSIYLSTPPAWDPPHSEQWSLLQSQLSHWSTNQRLVLSSVNQSEESITCPPVFRSREYLQCCSLVWSPQPTDLSPIIDRSMNRRNQSEKSN